MNKLRIVSLIAIVLFIMNMVLLGYIKMRKGPGHDGPRNAIIERLHFDKDQVTQYDALIAHHRTAIRSAEEEIRELKNQLYAQLVTDNEITDKQDSLIAKMVNVQTRIEYIHLTHFLEIKKCCKPEQIPYFGELTKEIAQLFTHNPRPHK